MTDNIGVRCGECGHPIPTDEYIELCTDDCYLNAEDFVYIEHKECTHTEDVILKEYGTLVLVRCNHG